MTPEEKRDDLICKHFALMGDFNPNVAEVARTKLLKLLAKHGLSFNDGLKIVAAAAAANKPPPLFIV